MMKSYKDFEKEFIGDSDIATLIMLGYDSKEFHADVIKVFRAKEFGCIIQLLKEEKEDVL